jgi:SAM-dependent MidA family methyltransferase
MQMAKLLGSPAPFWIIEQGAHDAQLAVDILSWLREAAPELFAAVRYAIVDPGTEARERQRENLAKTGLAEKVTRWSSLASLAMEKPVGVFLSNELVDALPVRVVKFTGGQWRERVVTMDASGAFTWADAEIIDESLCHALHRANPPAAEGYTTEIPLRAMEWMRDVAGVLQRGYVLTIDYGYTAAEYFAPERSGGTLTAYRHHQRSGDVLQHVGGQDMTAHVNFTALIDSGKNAGLAPLGLVDQARFLTGIAHDTMAGAMPDLLGIAQQTRAWNMLTHPNHFGARFRVPVQGRDGPGGLDGLRYG